MTKNEFFKKLNKRLVDLKVLNLFTHNVFIRLFVSGLIVVFVQVLYLLLRFSYINNQVPFWYTNNWGFAQLASKEQLFLIPLLSLIFVLFGLVFIFFSKKYYLRYGSEIAFALIIFALLFLSYSMFQIIFIASVPFESLINPAYLEFVGPFVLAFLFAYFIVPKFIDFAKDQNIVTNPFVHNHPGMVLTKPSARGGGLVFTFVFIVVSLIFVPFTFKLLGVYLPMILLALLGFFDDYQNTHPTSKVRFLEKPLIRLALMFVIVYISLLFDIRIDFISNPFFGGIIEFDKLPFLTTLQISWFAQAFTVVWIVWVLNVLSWSNGIDGQYGGIVGIAGIVVALLALRFVPITVDYKNVALLGVILAGASLGLLPYTWHPSKIMWGFGAMSAGFALSALSILINSRIATSVVIILIPFLDAVVSVIRRILQKKNPLIGDRGHLHHLLMERGWSIRKIAVFYWLNTALSGAVAIYASKSYLIQATLILGGIVAFFILLLNLDAFVKNGNGTNGNKSLNS